MTLEPFKKVSRLISMNQRAGKIIVKYRKNIGIEETGKTKPDKSCDGKNPVNIANCIATICLRVITEIKSPCAR